ncbi:phasin family protein [Burkholderia sp. LMG 21824]|uniref:phasin family protein n=1 Tax=Burkholderia sp. LMG 21824 TaxID=3158172 RepID=UPI003C2B331D
MDNPSKLLDDINSIARQFKIPGVDVDAMLKGRRKDVEALLQIGKITVGSTQSLVQKQVEMLRVSAEEMRDVLGSATKLDGVKLDVARKAAQTALSNFSEMAEIALQSQSEAFDTVKKRAHENIEELKSLIGTKPQDDG